LGFVVKGRKKAKMTTLKQSKFINKMAENSGNMYKSARDAGYSSSVAKDAGRKIRDSLGVKEALNGLGLSPYFVIKCLKNDIIKKPGKRTKELELASKILGLYMSNVCSNIPEDINETREQVKITNNLMVEEFEEFMNAYEEEDVAKLPIEIANILIEKERAEEIREN